MAVDASQNWCMLCVANVDACVGFAVWGLECVGMHNSLKMEELSVSLCTRKAKGEEWLI